MFYRIKNSVTGLIVVKNETDIIYDDGKRGLGVGDEVSYLHNKKQHRGTILRLSENREDVVSKSNKSPHASGNPSGMSPSSSKRQRKPKKRFSHSDFNQESKMRTKNAKKSRTECKKPSTTKGGEKKTEAENSELESPGETEEESAEDSSEDTEQIDRKKKQDTMEEQRKNNAKAISPTSAHDNSSHEESDNDDRHAHVDGKENDTVAGDSDEDLPEYDDDVMAVLTGKALEDNTQLLFGENPSPDEAVPIGRGIFCTTKAMLGIHSSAKCGTHVGRRLLKGVFKESVLKQATRTGEKSHSSRDENVEMVHLHKRALDAIIDFAFAFHKTKKLKDPVTKKGEVIKLTKSMIEASIAQHLGEIKNGKK